LCAGHGVEYLLVNALSLIKQLTEEIDDLKEDKELYSVFCEDYKGQVKKLTEENERLRADKDYWKNRTKESESEYDQAVKRGYELGTVDSVKSFAERLKAETITIQDHTGKLGLVVLVGTIDQIAKEMVEGAGNG
jgi:FtsZ-binding cell division protein ZapB